MHSRLHFPVLIQFIKADAELFRLLLRDLFPSLDLPEIESGDLGRQIETELVKAGLQTHPIILQKAIELRDSKATRHCNMIVGRTLSGKSVTWRMLAAASTSLAAATSSSGAEYHKVRVEVINPKSISMNELYGAYDLQTMEWSDGVLSSVFRMFARDDRPDEKWLVLDGPVDTLWIESMNTVMDDNKTLTLINGDRIGMSESMSLLFEVQDLAVASPATVSRAGMVYIDVVDLGWGPYVATWTDRTFAASTVDRDLITALFSKYVARLLKFKRRECRELVPVSDFNAVISLCNLLTALYTPENGLGTATAAEAPGYDKVVERWFTFACVWSLGAAVDEAGRRRFNDCLREIEPLFPPVGLVYDYAVDAGTRDFKPWADRLSASWRPAKDAPFARIIVPTVDTVRNLYVMQTLMAKGTHILLVGNTGTGKTVLAAQQLESLNPEEFSRLTVNFSSATSSNTVQDSEYLTRLRSLSKGSTLALLVRSHRGSTREALQEQDGPTFWQAHGALCGRPEHAPQGYLWVAAAARAAAAVGRLRRLVRPRQADVALHPRHADYGGDGTTGWRSLRH